jgi:hypothetical protein
MIVSASLAKLKAEITTLQTSMINGGQEPLIVYVVNDPERRHPGPDETVIDGVRLLRGEGEDREAFVDRVRQAAIAAGLQVVAISAESLDGPYRDDLVGGDDPLKTIEV